MSAVYYKLLSCVAARKECMCQDRRSDFLLYRYNIYTLHIYYIVTYVPILSIISDTSYKLSCVACLNIGRLLCERLSAKPDTDIFLVLLFTNK